MIHVTTIVNNIYPSDLFLWQCQMREEGYSPEEIGRMAAEMGTRLHKTAEDVLAGKEETDGMLCYIKLKEWLGQYKITKILATEQKVFYYSEEGGYEGKLDTAMYLVLEDEEGSNWIIDIKSYGLYNYRNKTDFIPLTAQQKAKTNLQTWLYSQATHDKIGRHLDYKAFRRGCLHINELGYELYEFKRKPIKKIIERAQTLFTKTF